MPRLVISYELMVRRNKSHNHEQNTHNLRGFTLLELLVAIAIVLIIATVVVILINPAELLKRGRDSVRISDLENIQKAINTIISETEDKNDYPLVFCDNLTPPCMGSSLDNNSDKNNGTGWVKVDFSNYSSVNVSSLPIDPKRDLGFDYKYYSDGESFELSTVLESSKEKHRMTEDNGNSINAYEVGTNLFLIN